MKNYRQERGRLSKKNKGGENYSGNVGSMVMLISGPPPGKYPATSGKGGGKDGGFVNF